MTLFYDAERQKLARFLLYFAPSGQEVGPLPDEAIDPAGGLVRDEAEQNDDF